jgi:hypothetical protein
MKRDLAAFMGALTIAAVLAIPTLAAAAEPATSPEASALFPSTLTDAGKQFLDRCSDEQLAGASDPLLESSRCHALYKQWFAQAGACRRLHGQRVAVELQPREAACVPAQRQHPPAQRQLRGDARQQRRDAIVVVVQRQLLRQPVAVLAHEAFAGHQAGARRQGQACAAFVHGQSHPPRARIAHALDFDATAVIERERQRVALDRTRLRRQQAEQGGHACG